MRTGLNCLKIRSIDVLWIRQWNYGFHKVVKISWSLSSYQFLKNDHFNGNNVMRITERIPILAGNLNHVLSLSPFTHLTWSSFDSSHCRRFRRHLALFICYIDSIILPWCRRTRFQRHALALTPSTVDPRHRSQRASVLSTVTIGRKGATRSMTGVRSSLGGWAVVWRRGTLIVKWDRMKPPSKTLQTPDYFLH